jgi:hypothetical protein
VGNFPCRVNLRVSQETYDVYSGLAQLQGRSVSAVIREVLDLCSAEVSVMSDALRAALGANPTDGTNIYRQYMASVHQRAGAEAARAEVWHKEVEELIREREASTV